MNRLKAFVTTAAVVTALGSFSSARAQSGTVTAHDAWAREPAPARDVTAVFVVLENSGHTARAVVAAESPASDKAEMHEMKNENGMMRMSPVNEIVVPAGGKTELKPGGLHIMLFGLKRRPAAGDSLTVTLTLDDGSKIPLTASVRKLETQP